MVFKKLKFTDERMVVPIRTFWVRNGYELVLAEDGALYSARWGLAKRLRDLDEAEGWLQRAGGRP